MVHIYISGVYSDHLVTWRGIQFRGLKLHSNTVLPGRGARLLCHLDPLAMPALVWKTACRYCRSAQMQKMEHLFVIVERLAEDCQEVYVRLTGL